MGFSKKSQVGKGLDIDGRKWVIAGISIRASLKPVKTKLRAPEREAEAEDGGQYYDFSEENCTTPTARETKIPEKLKCPPAPSRKRRPALRCRSNVVKEYFTPPSDLETAFIKREVILKSFDS